MLVESFWLLERHVQQENIGVKIVVVLMHMGILAAKLLMANIISVEQVGLECL